MGGALAAAISAVYTPAAGGGGTISLGNHTKGRSGTSSVTGDSTINTPSGATLYIGISFDGGVTVSSVTDVAGNTYTQVGTPQAGGGNQIALYYCSNATGHASNNATVTFSGTAFASLFFGALPDAATASLDSGASNKGTGSTSPYTLATAGASLAQSVNIVLYLIGTSSSSGTANTTFGNSFTEIDEEQDGGNYWTGAIGYLLTSATTTVTGSVTHSDAGGITVNRIIAVFKD